MPEIHAAESPDPFAAFQPGWARTYYVDYYVRADDAASLRSGEWLRDPILAFWGAHLQAQAGEGVAVLAPSIVSLLRLLSTPAEARELVRPLRLGERECVVCFVNNSETRSGQSSSGGHGTHWSLLVYDRCRGWPAAAGGSSLPWTRWAGTTRRPRGSWPPAFRVCCARLRRAPVRCAGQAARSSPARATAASIAASTRSGLSPSTARRAAPPRSPEPQSPLESGAKWWHGCCLSCPTELQAGQGVPRLWANNLAVVEERRACLAAFTDTGIH
eukprot:TRINITY_DN2267_c0_g1_i2.p1 TRINITY_DN2267_c0_g1~~TRINITY_DN2267_c0_g1_i2.p1  ORF type:complete len:273 (+),score=5.77 TRINITY_DN2267_c0_g1_i2:75-893(+)